MIPILRGHKCKICEEIFCFIIRYIHRCRAYTVLKSLILQHQNGNSANSKQKISSRPLTYFINIYYVLLYKMIGTRDNVEMRGSQRAVVAFNFWSAYYLKELTFAVYSTRKKEQTNKGKRKTETSEMARSVWQSQLHETKYPLRDRSMIIMRAQHRHRTKMYYKNQITSTKLLLYAYYDREH